MPPLDCLKSSGGHLNTVSPRQWQSGQPLLGIKQTPSIQMERDYKRSIKRAVTSFFYPWCLFQFLRLSLGAAIGDCSTNKQHGPDKPWQLPARKSSIAAQGNGMGHSDQYSCVSQRPPFFPKADDKTRGRWFPTARGDEHYCNFAFGFLTQFCKRTGCQSFMLRKTPWWSRLPWTCFQLWLLKLVEIF